MVQMFFFQMEYKVKVYSGVPNYFESAALLKFNYSIGKMCEVNFAVNSNILEFLF